jgi:hypothetical protein
MNKTRLDIRFRTTRLVFCQTHTNENKVNFHALNSRQIHLDSMITMYLKRPLDIIQLCRFVSLVSLLTCSELRFFSCHSSLNEYLGFNHSSILFYYVLMWIAFAFELYFLLNRLLNTNHVNRQHSTMTLHCLLALTFILAACCTFYAWLTRSNGHPITQHDLHRSMASFDLPVTDTLCNSWRWIGVTFGFIIGILYLMASLFIYRSRDLV